MHNLLDLLTRRDKVRLLVVLIAAVAMAAVEMLGIASIMPFMAVATRPDAIQTNQTLRYVFESLSFEDESAFLMFLGAVTLGFLITSNGLRAANTWLALKVQHGLGYDLARRLLSVYIAKPYSFHMNRSSSELSKNVLGEVQNVVIGVVKPAIAIVSSGLTSIAIVSLVVFIEPSAALGIAIVLGGTYTCIYVFVRKRLSKLGVEQVRALRGKFKTAGEAFSGIKDVKVLGRELVLIRRFANHAWRHARVSVSIGLISQMPRFALETVAFGGILLLMLTSLSRGKEATEMIPLLALYAFAGYRLLPALQLLFQSLAVLRSSEVALRVLHDDLIVNSEHGIYTEKWLETRQMGDRLGLSRNLTLQRVSFRYPLADENTLSNLSLTINANTMVGLVGPTGAGKTTVVDIITGILTPSEGQLLIDGVEITPSNVTRWQRSVGYVPQYAYMSDDTIARNIAFAVPDEEIDMDAVRNAARIANLDEFICRDLPDGYLTNIGERGVKLSGGQLQRIGIARALYHNPAILLMDEATNALDGVTENAVMDAVRRLPSHVTTILIAHRLTTVRDCDMVYLLDAGAIVATGTFNELISASSWFREAARQ